MTSNRTARRTSTASRRTSTAFRHRRSPHFPAEPVPDDPALIRARGILVIRTRDFARQLTTFRGTAGFSFRVAVT